MKARINILRGFKIVLEDLVILVIWSSALFKMNLQSFIELALVILYYFSRSSRSLRLINDCMSICLLLRLLLALSNMQEGLNPMSYPVEYQKANWDMYGQWQFAVPWIDYLDGYRNKAGRQQVVQWAYWSCLYTFNNK